MNHRLLFGQPAYREKESLLGGNWDNGLIKGFGEMETDTTTAIGLMAAVLTTSAFLPQVIKTWCTRMTRDISLGMFLVLCLGICLWVIYGLLRGDLPVILGNAVSLALAGTILLFKLKYK